MTDEAATDSQSNSAVLHTIMGSWRQLGYELRIQQQEVVLNLWKVYMCSFHCPLEAGKAHVNQYFHGPTMSLDAAQNQARSSLL